MKNEILANLHDPGQLEKLYRRNKASFKQAFRNLYPELKGNLLAEFWNERLHYDNEEINWGTTRELVMVLLAALVAGFIAKIPSLFQINEEFFYPRNIGFIFLPLLMAYFARQNKLQPKLIGIVGGGILLSLIYINLLPESNTSDTLILACIHLPLLLWSLLGVTFAGNNFLDYNQRLNFLKYNGDLVVMTTLILIAGGLLTGITIGLFSLIGFQIKQLYFEYFGVFGLAAAPIVGTYLTQTNPQLVNKVSPVIAKIFSPLVLVMLLVYLGAIVYSGKDPYNDREFLIIFNLLLIGVMAIIFFSVAESFKTKRHTTATWVLFLLSTVTVLVNGIALSAIVFRIAEWGLTPNRLAVLGSNLLMLLHLLFITFQFYKVLTKKSEITTISRAIAIFLPIYSLWAASVFFLFPLVFNFK
ncbi:DUF4153 domain-containing protein [Adhaeribacter pallidiroseus]|uniref:DUF4153 domain-containing protein n=1 Tax=Adhaeribacter pallidiroseus TaxID=2072847 RepID=A0A369QGU9_9BACT|nr:DUF4153 domain-containing protein [Adhaeribacter pallidiroseus]RDC64153.1 hypothetical protein AHMF7616_02764 [Adhaeribacter pallidiroseus]